MLFVSAVDDTAIDFSAAPFDAQVIRRPVQSWTPRDLISQLTTVRDGFVSGSPGAAAVTGAEVRSLHPARSHHKQCWLRGASHTRISESSLQHLVRGSGRPGSRRLSAPRDGLPSYVVLHHQATILTPPMRPCHRYRVGPGPQRRKANFTRRHRDAAWSDYCVQSPPSLHPGRRQQSSNASENPASAAKSRPADDPLRRPD